MLLAQHPACPWAAEIRRLVIPFVLLSQCLLASWLLKTGGHSVVLSCWHSVLLAIAGGGPAPGAGQPRGAQRLSRRCVRRCGVPRMPHVGPHIRHVIRQRPHLHVAWPFSRVLPPSVHATASAKSICTGTAFAATTAALSLLLAELAAYLHIRYHRRHAEHMRSIHITADLQIVVQAIAADM